MEVSSRVIVLGDLLENGRCRSASVEVALVLEVRRRFPGAHGSHSRRPVAYIHRPGLEETSEHSS